jgi:hypothetical protein
MQVSSQLHLMGKISRYPLDRNLGGSLNNTEKFASSDGNRTPAVQPVAIPAHRSSLYFHKQVNVYLHKVISVRGKHLQMIAV